MSAQTAAHLNTPLRSRKSIPMHSAYGKTPTPFHIKLLNDTFESRSKKNARYSLRAFARDIGISASHLVRVLASQKNLSIESARRIQKKLDLTPIRSNQFIQSVRESQDQTDESSNRITLERSRAIDPEDFQKISDWFYLAILELTEIDGYVANELNVSRSLSIPVKLAQSALDRLEEMKFLKKTSNGYKKVNSWVHTGGRDKTNLALRLHQKSLLFKAAENLDSIPLEERANFGSMYAIDPNQIGEAKELINQFLLDLEKLLAGKKRTRVYTAGIFLTPLSHLHEGKKTEK